MDKIYASMVNIQRRKIKTMRFKLLVLLVLLLISVLFSSCKDEPADEIPQVPTWITVPEYDFPIYIAKRGGVVTTALETFDVTGFLEVGDSTAFGDTLEWKVFPYNGRLP
jgi:hypothetical protein